MAPRRRAAPAAPFTGPAAPFPAPAPSAPALRLRDAVTALDAFITVVEIVPTRGTLDDPKGHRALETALELATSPSITALSVTDNAGGHAMLGPEPVAERLLATGRDVIVHVACRDRSRNELLGLGWRLVTRGLSNVLAVTGDYPVEGYGGLSRAVFDIDSVALLQMYGELNHELAVLAGEPGGPGGALGALTPAHSADGLFVGAVVSNHKRLESEALPQYLKLMRKLDLGARFVINQVGYNARKDDELLRYLRLRGRSVPVLANVYVLSRGTARAFNAGRVPGVVVTDELLAVVERVAASPDKGHAFFLELAARQVAIARGLGFAGAYIGGHVTNEDVERILQTAAGYGAEDWRDFAREVRYGQPGEFYLFEPERDSGLNADTLSRRYRAARTPRARARARLRAPISYRVNQVVHDAVFAPGTPLFRLGSSFYGTAERLHLMLPMHAFEHALKVPLYGCHDCGDCSLPDVAYLCPESRCAKHLRNGPCGGSRDGECEVPGKPCVWTLAYERLRADGAEERMLERPVIVADNALQRTSAWANTFLGRDHFAPGRAASALPGAPRPRPPVPRAPTGDPLGSPVGSPVGSPPGATDRGPSEPAHHDPTTSRTRSRP